MADRPTSKPDPDPKPASDQREDEPTRPSVAHEEDIHDWDEADETYTDPEHARRMAAVRTELFRRSQPKWEPEE